MGGEDCRAAVCMKIKPKKIHHFTPYYVIKSKYMYHTAVATDSIEKYCMQYSDFNRLQQLLMLIHLHRGTRS
jgi:hypothetical protein